MLPVLGFVVRGLALAGLGYLLKKTVVDPIREDFYWDNLDRQPGAGQIIDVEPLPPRATADAGEDGNTKKDTPWVT